MRCTRIFLIAVAILMTGLTACKKWEDDKKIGNPNLEITLSQAIAANANLSKFMQYVHSTGVDSLLASSKTYTVWAPDDVAMASIDPVVVSDPVKLKSFVLNHISNQSYFTRDAQTSLRLIMLSGKYNNFLGNKFDDATITSPDQFVKNGVLHVINKIVPVLPNLWDFVNTTQAQYVQNAYITSLNFIDFDPATAVIDSISSTTGLPVYHPGTGQVYRNRFNDKVHNLKNESRQYTYFVIVNSGFTLESDSLKPYYVAATPFLTDSLAKWNTVKDLAVEGAYPANALTGLISRSGVPIPINPAQIIQTIKLSNGIAYVLNKVDVVNLNKYKPIFVQGEFPSGFLSDKTANTNYRLRLNPVTNQSFYDIMITGHGVTTYYVYYRLNEMPSLKYQVYAVGVNDFQTATFSQTIVSKLFEPPATYTTLASLAHAVPLYTAAGAYNEINLGNFTSTKFGTLEIQVTCTATNPIVLDYLRLVPVL